MLPRTAIRAPLLQRGPVMGMGMGSRFSQSVSSSRYGSSGNGNGSGYGNRRSDDNDGDHDTYHDHDVGFDDVVPMGGCDEDHITGDTHKDKKSMEVVGNSQEASDHDTTAVKTESGPGLSQDDSGFQKISLSKTTKKLKVNEAPVAMRAGSASVVALSSQRGGVSVIPIPILTTTLTPTPTSFAHYLTST